MSKSIDDILRQQAAQRQAQIQAQQAQERAIGYGAVYLDWNLNGVADLPSEPSGGGDTDQLRFGVI